MGEFDGEGSMSEPEIDQFIHSLVRRANHLKTTFKKQLDIEFDMVGK